MVLALSGNPLGQPFFLHALIGGGALSLAAGAVGYFVVERQEAFAAHTISVMAFPGGALAALAGLALPAGFFLLCLAAGLSLALLRVRAGRWRALHSSALTGSVQAAALAVGFLALAFYGGVLEDLEALLFGSVFGIDRAQELELVTLAALLLLLLALVGRPLLFATVDRELARAAGLPVAALDLLFLLLLSGAIAAAAQVTGALLVLALLVGPAAIARTLQAAPLKAALLSCALSLLIFLSSLLLAYYTNLPLGFLLPVATFAFYGLSRARRGQAGGRLPVPNAAHVRP